MKNNEPLSKIGLVILAAGSSSRLGTPKQLVAFRGETLLRGIARESLASVCRPIVVVLGKNAAHFRREIEDLDVQIVENKDWERGMGTSISAGVRKIVAIEKRLAAVVVCVCDQPFVTGQTINRLVETFRRAQSPIVASAYGAARGVPALFDKSLFARLTDLQSAGGAKQIINELRCETVFVEFPEGAIDVDVAADLEKLRDLE